MKPLSASVNVVVSGGSGNAAFSFGGQLISTAIIPPSITDKYDYSILDGDSFGVTGKVNNVGNNVFYEFCHILSGGTVYILNASEDGTYRVKFLYDQSIWNAK